MRYLYYPLVAIALITILGAVVWRSESKDNLSKQQVQNAWELSYSYYTTEIGDKMLPQVPFMKDIWELRGEQLRYFVDFNEAMRSATSDLPSREPWLNQAESDWFGHYVRYHIFAEGVAPDDVELSDSNLKFVAEYMTIVQAVVAGEGDEHFNADYLSQRPVVVELVEKHDLRLFTREAIEFFSDYFDGE